MKKQSIIKSFAIVISLALFAFVAMVGITGVKSADRELMDYKAELAARYGVNEEVYVRDETERPLWYGEPQGAYIHTGYVGEGMREEDVKKVVVLNNGADAEEALGIVIRIQSRERNYGLLVFFSVFGIVAVLICAFCKEEEHQEIPTLYGEEKREEIPTL